MVEEARKCPYCGEVISANAKKCRHCGEWFEQTGSNFFIDFFAKDKFLSEKRALSIVSVIVFLILTITFVTATFINSNETSAYTWAILSVVSTLWYMISLKIINEVNKNEK